MSHIEPIPQPEFPSVPPRPRYHTPTRIMVEPRPDLSPAVKAMLRHAAGVFGWDRPDLATPSEEGLRKARHARWALDGLSDPGLMDPP